MPHCRKTMNVTTIIFVLYVISSFFIAAPAYSKESFKLKPGAEGKLCLKCHETVKKTANSRFVHPLVKKMDCTGCHNPHTSSHKNLLTAGTRELCYNCHKEVLPESARSAHEIVVEGNCTKCHDAHGASKKFILSEEGNALCFDCHNDMGDEVGKVRFKHRSLESGKGCLNCHDPHASAKSEHLLRTEVPLLCKKCHKTEKLTFKRTHMDYPVGNVNCTSCHDPHGSNQRGIMFDTAHAAVVERKCTDCHQKPPSLKTKKQTTQLCRDCHRDMVAETLEKNRVHWPLVDDVGCLNCHSPHAGDTKNLLKQKQTVVCRECHEGTFKRHEDTLYEHKATASRCNVCHVVHGTDQIALLKGDANKVCLPCHPDQGQFSHPIGVEALDPRNNQITSCVSCHHPHGSNYKGELKLSGHQDLCVQCHHL